MREVIRETRRDDHDLTECAVRVTDSPAACRRVIRALDTLVTARTDPRWSSVRDEVLNLAAKIQREDERVGRRQHW